ncbi:hypothetical protein AURDEDRAFT_154327 [Auricularia subglabra TFB-10046 SS5]|uniref:Uncharacterized protein n=1 Tax=Auricularia subglabra (strain TFB-10046 / SS5) TaxID=717982 RepID=J0WW60_AURST|nr:hypothetical protein AURDEDRAFT_154327 [Auricularia subglabra TFB-10046 SS5]
MSSSATVSEHLAPAIKAGIYSYHPTSGLSINGIPRCQKAQLLQHLAFVDPGPALTKKGKPRVHQPVRPQDQSAEFYCAQMVHYGLATATDAPAPRDAAKQALRGSTLLVPAAVLDVEAGLKTRYDEENDRLRGGTGDKAEAGRQKRQRAAGEPGVAGSSDQPASKRAKQSESAVKLATGPVNLDAISGYYHIIAKVEMTFADEPLEDGFEFGLAVSPKRSHIWGKFDFGPFHGVLRSTRLLTSADGAVSFHWCGIDEEIGAAVYGSENSCTIQFLPGGNIKGAIDGWPCDEPRTVEFTGIRLFNAPMKEDAAALKAEYWGLYQENFENDAEDDYPRFGSFSRMCARDFSFNSDTEDSSASADEEDLDDYDGFSIRCAYDGFY